MAERDLPPGETTQADPTPTATGPEAGSHGTDQPDERWSAAAGSVDERVPGWREVIIVAAAIVVGVLALAVLTSILPTGMQDIVFRTPLAIVVLVVVTIGLLARLGRGSSG